METWGKRFVLTAVTLIWIANWAAPFWVPTYESKESINVIFMAIVGWRLARRDQGPGD